MRIIIFYAEGESNGVNTDAGLIQDYVKQVITFKTVPISRKRH